ncbi:TonB-dependent receptor [Rubrivivax albus]|uniref:TonB-dependent receptor n=2 Tax=Rubrivivax albus TaxID=2499835 RepID=A0A3S2W028_9BURK|nr:TonB-dependent receptor [Rubrivivax albus]
MSVRRIVQFPAMHAIAVASLLVCGPDVVRAQAAVAAAAESSDTQTVVVTANKRKQPAADVAGTVSVIQGSALEANGVADQEGAFKLTPGVQVNKGDPGRNVPAIRGIGTNANTLTLGFQQSTTGIYIEDVPMTDPFAFMNAADVAPFDLERMEVLRGPQGALYGSSSLGGAVRYLLAEPELQAQAFSVLASGSRVVGGGTDHAIYLMGNQPLAKGVAGVRVMAFDRVDAGWIKNLGTQAERANRSHTSGARLSGLAKPNRSLTISANVMHQRNQLDDTMAVAPDPRQLTASNPTASTRRSTLDFANVTIDAELGSHTLTSITGYWRKENDSHSDVTRLFDPAFRPSGIVLPAYVADEASNSDMVSQEIRLASSQQGPLRYLVGALISRTRFELDGPIRAVGAVDAGLGALFPNDVLGLQTGTARMSENALFFDGDFDLTPAWTVGLGGRAYSTKTNYNIAFLSNLPSNAPFRSPSLSEDGFTPKATLRHKFGAHQWYALVSQGYRFGGVNFRSQTPYKSDKLTNYETGVRLLPSKDLRVDATVFLLDWKNVQVTTLNGGFLDTSNVGAAKSKGLELSVGWRATPSFSVDLAAAFIDAKTTVAYDGPAGKVPSGSRLPGSARTQVTLAPSYSFAGPAGTSGRVSSVISQIGARNFDIAGSGSAPGYTTMDLRLSLARDAWELTLFANNATDQRGVVGALADAAYPYRDYFLVRPRTVGVSLRWDH